jgi:hypothetical protein
MHTLLVRSGEEAANASLGQLFDVSSLADACKKLDIDIGRRHEDYCFNGCGLASWAKNTTDIETETGEVFGGEDITGQM